MRVKSQKKAYEQATFTGTDLWIDTEESPCIWSNGVLSDHLTPDPVAHDWLILKDDTSMICDEAGNCNINVRFKRDFETDDARDHQLNIGLMQDFQFQAFYATHPYGKIAGPPIHKGLSAPITIALHGINSLAASAAAIVAASLLF